MSELVEYIEDLRDLEVGRFIHQFGMLENTVALLTWGVMDLTARTGQTVTRHLSLKATTRLLAGIAEAQYPQELAAQIRRWVTRVDKLAEKRNVIAHSAWFNDDEAEEPTGEIPIEEVVLEKFDMKRLDRVATFSLSDLRDLTKEAHALGAVGFGLFFAIPKSHRP